MSPQELSIEKSTQEKYWSRYSHLKNGKANDYHLLSIRIFKNSEKILFTVNYL